MFQVWCVCAARDGVDTLDAACALLIQAKSAAPNRTSFVLLKILHTSQVSMHIQGKAMPMQHWHFQRRW